ncbi:unnamed protein product [Heterobilharzia americana]|nr:unnamed protein product [Heterobilharzia americana]
MSLSHSTSPNFGGKSVFNTTGRSQSVTGDGYLQVNNNCFEEEEEWQSKLDKWREKRRQALRTEATHLVLLQERESKENERRREEAKDRLRQVKNQRSLVGSGHISSLELASPPTIKSPGVALLTGSAFDPLAVSHLERHVDAVATSQSVPVNKSRSTESPELLNSNSSEIDLNGISDCSPPVRQTKTELLKNTTDKIIDISPSKNDSILKHAKYNPIEIIRDPSTDGRAPPDSGSDNQKLISSPETKNSVDLFTKHEDYSECKLRLSARPGVSESCWGLTVKAEGPSNTSPFVVERVKIGSSADICEFQKGDILTCIDGRSRKLMTQLAVTNRPITVLVLRKADEFDEANYGEHDAVEDYAIESSTQKSLYSQSNVDNSDNECSEVVISPTSVASTKVSAPDAPVSQRPITISHSLHMMHSESSIQISDDEVSNSSVSSICEENDVRVFNRQKRSVVGVSSTSSFSSDKNEVRVFKTYQSKFETEKVGTTCMSTPSQSDLIHCNGTSSAKQDAEITLMEPVHFTLATASILSPCIQTNYQVRTPTLAMEDIATAVFENENKSHEKSRFVNTSLEYLPTSASNTVQTSSISTLNYANVTSPSWLSPRMRHTSRTFHIHPKLPDSSNDIPFHIPSGSRGSFTLKYKQNSLPNPPPSSYFLCDANLVKPTQINSARPNIPPRPISKTSRAPSQFSSSITVSESRSLPLVSGETSGVNPTKTGFISELTKSSFSQPSDSDAYPNTSKIFPPPPPAAPLPVTKQKQLHQNPLHNSNQKTDVEGYLEKPGIERKGVNSSNKVKTPLPTPPQKYADLEAEVPPVPPRTPHVRIVDLDQLCAACNAKLGFEDSMVIESLNLYYHLPCFVCARCGILLGDGLSDVEVRVRRNLLYCSSCYSKDRMNLTDNKTEYDPKTRSQQPASQPLKPPRPTDRRHHRHGSEQQPSNLNKLRSGSPKMNV